MDAGALTLPRRETRQVMVGTVAVGGGAPVSVQSMTTTKTADVEGTPQQIYAPAAAVAPRGAVRWGAVRSPVMVSPDLETLAKSKAAMASVFVPVDRKSVV